MEVRNESVITVIYGSRRPGFIAGHDSGNTGCGLPAGQDTGPVVYGIHHHLPAVFYRPVNIQKWRDEIERSDGDDIAGVGFEPTARSL